MPNEFEAAANMLAVDREAAAAAERKRIEEEANRQERERSAAEQAKRAAEARWPEVKALLTRAVEAYNAKSASTGVHLTLGDEMTMHGWLQPYRLTVSRNNRMLAVVFTIGQTNKVGYQFKETLQHGQSSAIPAGMGERGGTEDIKTLVNQIVESVAKAR